MFRPMPPVPPPVPLPAGLPPGWTLIGHRISATIEGRQSAVTADETAGASRARDHAIRLAGGLPISPRLTATEAG